MSDPSDLSRTQRGWTRIRNALKKIAATPEHARTDLDADGRRWRLLRVECVSPAGEVLPAAAFDALAEQLGDVRALEFSGRPLDHPDLPEFVRRARDAGAAVTVVLDEPAAVPEGAMLAVRAVVGPDDADRLEDLVRDAAAAGAAEIRFRPGPGARESRALHRAVVRSRRFAAGTRIAWSAFSEDRVERPICEADPRDALAIRADGSVSPCEPLADREIYGTLGDAPLPELVECEAYRTRRDRFTERLAARETRFFNTIMGTRGGYDKAIRETREWMPEPPPGCRECPWICDHMGRDIIG